MFLLTLKKKWDFSQDWDLIGRFFNLVIRRTIRGRGWGDDDLCLFLLLFIAAVFRLQVQVNIRASKIATSIPNTSDSEKVISTLHCSVKLVQVDYQPGSISNSIFIATGIVRPLFDLWSVTESVHKTVLALASFATVESQSIWKSKQEPEGKWRTRRKKAGKKEMSYLFVRFWFPWYIVSGSG